MSAVNIVKNNVESKCKCKENAQALVIHVQWRYLLLRSSKSLM